MAARKKVGRKVNARARLGQIGMDGSVNASLDSKSRYVVLAYRQSRWTSVCAFCRACREEGLGDETRITMFSSDLNIRHNTLRCQRYK